jgi:hypothetical protein
VYGRPCRPAAWPKLAKLPRPPPPDEDDAFAVAVAALKADEAAWLGAVGEAAVAKSAKSVWIESQRCVALRCVALSAGIGVADIPSTSAEATDATVDLAPPSTFWRFLSRSAIATRVRWEVEGERRWKENGCRWYGS